MPHTQRQLDAMSTTRLRNFILGYCVVASTKHLKKVIPAANEFDFRRKRDCLLFYAHITQSIVLV